MSHQAVGWALEQDVPNAAKFVLVALAYHADADNLAWPSHLTLARECSVSEAAIKRQLRVLVALGAISRDVRPRENRPNESNLYRLHVDRGSVATPYGDQQRPPEEVITDPLGGQQRPPRGSVANPSRGSVVTPRIVTLEESGEESKEAAAAAARGAPEGILCPPELREMDAVLQGARGYDPRRSFYDTVKRKYLHLDLVEEALKARSYTEQKPKQPCSTLFLLNWFSRSTRGPLVRSFSANGSNGHGAVSRSSAGGHQAPARAVDIRQNHPSVFEQYNQPRSG